jgi:hypothetical protein
MARAYADEQAMVNPAYIEAARLVRCNTRKGGDANYARLLRRMDATGMIEFRERRPLVVNGFFAVQKGDGWLRLIIDCRPVNSVFRRPLRVVLPNPSSFHRLPERVRYAAKADLSNYYHSLGLPEWMIKYFGLPRVRSDKVGLPGEPRWVWPCCRTVPMGWSHAPLIAEEVHYFVLREVLADGSEHIFVYIYIDDLIIIGVHEIEVNELLDAALTAYRAAKLPVKMSKVHYAAVQQVVLGLEFDGDAKLFHVSAERIGKLSRYTEWLCATPGRWVSGALMRRVIGHWLWVILVRRPVLSVLRHVFTFQERYKLSKGRLWRVVREELLTLFALAPMLAGSFRSFAPVVLAADASTAGYGVTVTRPSPAGVEHVAALAELRGEYVRLDVDYTGMQVPSADFGGARMERSEVLGPWVRATALDGSY